ncbi:MAG: LD-carboxypeptidase [Candidatus Omnitrophota bacterium]
MSRQKQSLIRKVKPQGLKRGDTIGIVAPASSFDPEKFKVGARVLRKLGYKLKYERAMFSKYWSQPGHDKNRAEQINRMFADCEVKAIFCAKAGYGSIDIIPYLDREIIRQNPKIFVGYSDITILLLYLQEMTNMVVFHGPVVSSEIYDGMNYRTLDYLIQLISKPRPLGKIEFSSVQSLGSGKATGRLVGGNLSLIVQAIGTAYDINTDDSILFLEEVGEDLETIRGYFNRLKKSGKFENIRGMVFGKMVDCFPNSGQTHSLKDILTEMLAEFKFPVLFRFPSGHIKNQGETRVTLPLGISVTIDADKPCLIINRAAVR